MPPDAAQMVAFAEFLDGRRIVEQIGQHFGVSRAAGRVGIVLHHVKRSVGKVRIQARGNFRHLVTGIDGGQHFLGRQQFHAGQQAGTVEHHTLHAVDSADEGLARFHQTVVLAAGDEIGAQKRADQASAGGEVLLFHALVEIVHPGEVTAGAVL